MRWMFLVLVVVVASCASTKAPVPITAPADPPGPVEGSQDRPPPRLVLPPQELDRLTASDPVPDVTPAQAAQAIRRANRRAVVRPRPQDFTKALVVYPYCLGCVYTLALAPHIPTRLLLPVGEAYVTAGHDEWFQVESRTVGQPPQDHILIVSKLSRAEFPALAKKPYRVTVMTTKAVYDLRVHIVDDHEQSMTAVAWQHPEPARTTRERFPPGVYHVGYDILGDAQQPPRWTPLGVWDTGRGGQTLIQFPPALSTGSAPVLYVLGPDGAKRLTTPVASGLWYVVDEQFEAAELRVGHDEAAQVVTLRRNGVYRSIRCPDDPACPRATP